MNKRTKAHLSPELAFTPTTSLVSEVWDCFLEAGKREWPTLLAFLLKRCPDSVLSQVRDEAVKRGILVVNKPSPFQRAAHSCLDQCFSFLQPSDLRRSESVCRRWRAASVHSNAGWVTALNGTSNSGSIDNAWSHDIIFRRISVARLTAITAANLGPSARNPNTLRLLSTLPNFKELTVYMGSLDSTVLRHLQPPCRLEKLQLLNVDGPSSPVDPFVEGPAFAQLQELRLHRCEASDLVQVIEHLPALLTLDVRLMDDDFDPEFHYTHYNLTELILRHNTLPKAIPIICNWFAFPALQLFFPVGLQLTKRAVRTMSVAMPNLSGINLERCVVSTAAMDELKILPNLSEVFLGKSSRRYLRSMLALPHLRSLQFGISGLQPVERWSGLLKLISNCKVVSLAIRFQTDTELLPVLLKHLPPTLRHLCLEFDEHTCEVSGKLPTEFKSFAATNISSSMRTLTLGGSVLCTKIFKAVAGVMHAARPAVVVDLGHWDYSFFWNAWREDS